MRAAVALLILVGLTSCASSPHPSASNRQWLVGTWLMLDRPGMDVSNCNSGLPIRYLAEGTYELWQEQGVWELRDSTLSSTATAAGELIDPAEVALGRTSISRIDFSRRDAFTKTFADGSRYQFIRCPEASD